MRALKTDNFCCWCIIRWNTEGVNYNWCACRVRFCPCIIHITEGYVLPHNSTIGRDSLWWSFTWQMKELWMKRCLCRITYEVGCWKKERGWYTDNCKNYTFIDEWLRLRMSASTKKHTINTNDKQDNQGSILVANEWDERIKAVAHTNRLRRIFCCCYFCLCLINILRTNMCNNVPCPPVLEEGYP